MSHTKEYEHLRIQLEAIVSSTNNFSSENCIGKGGFGKVYKGEIDVHSKGKSMVAFKRLDRAFGQGNPEFWKEIMMLSIYKHENIISLLGFCDESDEKILVYEYASKRSLDLYLSNDDLPWIERLKICTSAACGLAYLHNPFDTQLRVLHRDIKSSNILLDENWNAKISDFGLSKLGPANHQFTFLVTSAVGTIGYCDPLYVETGFLTKESDVYSFGVVLFEVLCGRLCVRNNDDKYQPLTRLARECYKTKKIDEIIHGSIKDEIDPNSLKLFTKIAYQCLKRDREKRPLMSEIVRILENALEYQCCSAPDQFPSDFPVEVAAEVLPLDGISNKRRLSSEQVHMLERSFKEEKTKLAEKLGLDPRQVAVWFQNRRARWKTKTLEEYYDNLRSSYDMLTIDFDSMVKENEKLKAEVEQTRPSRHSSNKHKANASLDDEQNDSRRGHSKPERWTSHKDVDFSLGINSSASSPNVEKTNRYDDTEPMKPVDESSKPKEMVEKSNSKSLVEENDDVKTGDEDKHLDTVEKLKL